jgi:peptidoglycan/xylan/chitin deacetylase (PgdA/CDA1 family)
MFRLLKNIIRYLLELVISVIDPRSFYFFNPNNLLILTYHRVLPSDHPDVKFEQPGMYVTPQTFKLHMQELKKRFEILHLDDWVNAVKNNLPLPKNACAITFDDGWLDNYEYAYPILKELDISATIFVVSGYTGTKYSFWPNRLSRVLGRLNKQKVIELINSSEGAWIKHLPIIKDDFISTGLNVDKINRIIEHCKIYTESQINEGIDKIENKFPDAIKSIVVDLLDSYQLDEMVKSGLVRIGSHTCHHKRLLDNLNKNEIDIEIKKSKEDLHSILDIPINLFCYPNGDYSDYALSLVKKYYTGACSTTRGWNIPKSDLMLLKRIGLHEDVSSSKRQFLAKISGFI